MQLAEIYRIAVCSRKIKERRTRGEGEGERLREGIIQENDILKTHGVNVTAEPKSLKNKEKYFRLLV